MLGFSAHSFYLNLLVRAVALLLGFAANILLANMLGPSEFGAYSFVLTVMTMLAVPLHEGAAVLLARETALCLAAGLWGRLRGALRAANVAVIASSSATSLVAFFVVRSSARPNEQVLWAWALLLLPFYCLAGLRGAVLRGLGYSTLGQLPDQILRPVLLIVGVLFTASSFNSGGAMRIHAGAALVAFMVGTYLVLSKIPIEARKIRVVYETGEWVRSLAPFTLIAGIQITNSSLATLLLEYFCDDAAVAYYRVAFLGASLISLSLVAAEQISTPWIVKLHADGHISALQAQITKITRSMIVASIPVALTAILFGKPLIGFFFGDSYLDAYRPLVVMVIGQMINVGTGMVGTLLLMTGHQTYAVKAVMIQIVVNLVLGVILVPIFGVTGAAISTAIAMAVVNIVCLWQVERLVGVRSLPW